MRGFLRFVAPPIIAGAIFVAPYAFPIGVFLSLIAGAPNDPPRMMATIVMGGLVIGLILDIFMAFVPALFFFIARASWASEEKIVGEHLFGWPIAIAMIAGVATFAYLKQGIFSISVVSMISLSVLMSAFAAGCGVIAAFVWRRLAYRR